jgi:hypothetical protein
LCCFSAKHASLMRKKKDWLTRNQDNVLECGDMSTRGLLFKRANTQSTALEAGTPVITPPMWFLPLLRNTENHNVLIYMICTCVTINKAIMI